MEFFFREERILKVISESSIRLGDIIELVEILGKGEKRHLNTSEEKSQVMKSSYIE